MDISTEDRDEILANLQALSNRRCRSGDWHYGHAVACRIIIHDVKRGWPIPSTEKTGPVIKLFNAPPGRQ